MEPVSILVCSRGRRSTLEKLVLSLRKMDTSYLTEVVVVEETDNPSPLTGVHYISHPIANRGIPYARNLAVANASGNIIVFLDDDCVISDGWLNHLLSPLTDSAVVGAQGGVVVPESSNAIGWSESILGFPGGGIRRVNQAKGEIRETFEISTLNCAYRKWVLDRIGGFDERLRRGREDNRLAKLACELGRCLFVPNAIVKHDPRGSLRKVWEWFVRRGEADMDWIRTGYQKGKDLKTTLRGSLAVKLVLVYLIGVLLNYAFLFVLGFVLLYGALQYRRFFRPWKDSGAPTSALLVLPLVKLTMDLALDWGRLRGVFFG